MSTFTDRVRKVREIIDAGRKRGVKVSILFATKEVLRREGITHPPDFKRVADEIWEYWHPKPKVKLPSKVQVAHEARRMAYARNGDPDD